MRISELIRQLQEAQFVEGPDREVIVEVEAQKQYIDIGGRIVVLDTNKGRMIALTTRPIED